MTVYRVGKDDLSTRLSKLSSDFETSRSFCDEVSEREFMEDPQLSGRISGSNIVVH